MPLRATLSDMTTSISPRRTRLVPTQKAKDLVRVVASITAYAVIGAGVALIGWGLLAATIITAQDFVR